MNNLRNSSKRTTTSSLMQHRNNILLTLRAHCPHNSLLAVPFIQRPSNLLVLTVPLLFDLMIQQLMPRRGHSSLSGQVYTSYSRLSHLAQLACLDDVVQAILHSPAWFRPNTKRIRRCFDLHLERIARLSISRVDKY